MTDTTCSVLVVEDERRLAELYADTLRESHEVETAYDGETALERLDAATDAVLLDRKMPGPSGRETLERIRATDHDPRVAMLTAVRPDFDIIEMGFDDYLLKPVDGPELHRSVARLAALDRVDGETREYVRRSVTKAALEGQKQPADLEASEAFARLGEELTETGLEVGDVTADLSPRETELILESITRNLEADAD